MGPLRLWTPVVLAPMAGVTDVPFRRLCRIMGESGLPDHLRPVGIPSRAAESGQAATASSPTSPGETLAEPRHVAIPHVDAPAGLYVTEMVTSRAR
ncbi:MAG: tRNA-dihydrouridine synthase, partial [Actinomyces sp.]|nr:tRNA-dihydrouridine synthase [Actinomyces sp.]